MWVEEEGLVFVQCRDANRAPIEPCAEVAAHRPRFVWAARNASGEDWTLHSTACRHQDSQESSGDDKMLPYRVQARAPPHAIRTARSPKMAHAPGRGMAPFCSHRTIPGCTDAYRRCSARSDPRLMRGAPPRPTAACARRPVRHPARSRLDLRREFDKTRPSSSTHTPSASHTTQKTHCADRTRSGSG